MKNDMELQRSCIKGEIAWREKNFGKMGWHCRTTVALLWIEQNAKSFREIWDKVVNRVGVGL